MHPTRVKLAFLKLLHSAIVIYQLSMKVLRISFGDDDSFNNARIN